MEKLKIIQGGLEGSGQRAMSENERVLAETIAEITRLEQRGGAMEVEEFNKLKDLRKLKERLIQDQTRIQAAGM